MTLPVGGFVPFSTVDWPGMLTAIVFTRGCTWRCPYCHNRHLLVESTGGESEWDEVSAFLSSRRGLLDGVVFSGGEPTLHEGLPAALAEVRKLGFAVALHTNGAWPDRLAAALPFVDWVGLDVKAPQCLYDQVTGVADSSSNAYQSLRLLAATAVDFEVRTTVDRALLGEPELRTLAEELEREGVRRWVLQSCRLPTPTPPFARPPLTDDKLQTLAAELNRKYRRPEIVVR